MDSFNRTDQDERYYRLEKLLVGEFKRAPAATTADYYKLIFQAVCGPGHFLASSRSVAAVINHEIQQIEAEKTEPSKTEPALKNEPLWVDITLTVPLVRVNLRPWLAEGHEANQLAELSYRTAGNFPPPSDGDLARFTALGLEILAQPPFNHPPAELDQFLKQLTQEAYPQVHHSRTYRQQYRPHYLLVEKPLLENQPMES